LLGFSRFNSFSRRTTRRSLPCRWKKRGLKRRPPTLHRTPIRHQKGLLKAAVKVDWRRSSAWRLRAECSAAATTNSQAATTINQEATRALRIKVARKLAVMTPRLEERLGLAIHAAAASLATALVIRAGVGEIRATPEINASRVWKLAEEAAAGRLAAGLAIRGAVEESQAAMEVRAAPEIRAVDAADPKVEAGLEMKREWTGKMAVAQAGEEVAVMPRCLEARLAVMAAKKARAA
jgi:hypothetical protein